MTTYTRSDIGLLPSRPGPGPLAALEVVGLVFHWPAMTSPLTSVDATMAALRGWQAYHMSKGWSDIAYQVAVDQKGNRYNLRGLDTQSAANGDEDLNDEYGAILLILAPGENPSREMVAEVHNVVRDHRRLFPNSDVLLGHSEVRPEPTACPGKIVQTLLETGAFEPEEIHPTRDMMKVDLAAAIAATKSARARAEGRPRILYQTEEALEHLRKARDINNASS